MPLAAGTILQNRYRIVKLIGQGGFGAVYRGWDLSLEQPVAVKENFGSDAESQRQFEREAKLLAGLRHPNLPRVIDHFVLPGQGQYLVMDFVEGQSLGALLAARGGPLAEAEALPWMRQVCDALTYLHGRTPPIIHRDIKPENIIITAEGRAMLVDFGISKVYDPSKGTTIGAKAVTPGYSPPEQYGRGRTDARSDVYALAATLYTLLTGQTPPEAPDLSSGADVLTPPRQVNRAVSKATSETIMAAMALSMSLRLADAAAFERQLPVASPPVASPSRAPLPPTQPPIPQPILPAGTSTSSGKHGVPVWGWLVGVAALVVLGVWAAVAMGGRNGENETSEQATAAIVDVINGAASVLPAATASEGNQEFPQPTGIAVDDEGNVYVTDSLVHRVQKFTADGALLVEWGSQGSAVRQFDSPQGIAVDGDGNIYVADSGNDRVQKFAANGNFLTEWGNTGSGEGQFYFPSGIAADRYGNVFVSDSSNDRIQKFSADGTFLAQWGSSGNEPGQFSFPVGIAVDSNGRVLVADTGNNGIQIFGNDGTFLAGLASEGSRIGQFLEPQGIAVDSDGNIYLADTFNSRIQKYTTDLRFVVGWGSEGSEEGQFSFPSGIAVDNDGNVYVVDTNNDRIQKFTADGEFLAMWGGEE